MGLIYARLQDLPWPERLMRMRHYLKVPVYTLRQLRKTSNLSTATKQAVEEAELKMNLLQDWADQYPKGEQ